MKVATWNVNGIRARASQVEEWMNREQPDVVCLQELKAELAQVPEVVHRPDYHAFWHCCKGYSGVSLQLRKAMFPAEPVYSHPPFDFESRIVQVEVGDLVIASMYVPNGGKDYPAKLAFLDAADRMGPAAACRRSRGAALRRRQHRAHRNGRPSEGAETQHGGTAARGTGAVRDPPGTGLTDVGRAMDPDNPDLFTWWAPWRNLRARNIGWRLDYLLASPGVAKRVAGCVVQADVGTSDHAPVVMT